MRSGKISVFLVALALCAYATAQAEQLVVASYDDVSEQSLLCVPHVATLPTDVAQYQKVSQPRAILATDKDKPDAPSVVSDARDGWCDECCCPIPASRMCPCTYGWADVLIMWRDNDAANRASVINLNTDETLISAGELGFGVGWGIRAGFGIRDACGCCGWEFEYLGVFDQSAGRSVERERS